jgi:hypothetical protein
MFEACRRRTLRGPVARLEHIWIQAPTASDPWLSLIKQVDHGIFKKRFEHQTENGLSDWSRLQHMQRCRFLS